MNPTSKKFISLFLVFSLVMLSTNLYAKKRGAKLLITKKDGLQAAGELITVKPKSLLLLDATGWDVSVDIVDIKVIRVVKKSKALLGAGLGVSALGIVPFLVATIFFPNSEESELRFIHAGMVGIGGLLVGGTIGAVAGIDKTIQIEGMTDSEIQEALDKLRKKARIRDYK